MKKRPARKNTQKKLIAKMLLFIPLLLFILFVSLFYKLKPRLEKSPEDTPHPRLPFFVANISASQKSQVKDKIVAEKLNLERKIIVPKSSSQVDRIQAVVKENGGQIVHAKSKMIVAFVPKETEEKIKQKLKAEDSLETMEIDYPTFLAADDPDWGVVKIEAPQVWPTTSAEGIKIAVVDTGIDYTHQDLQTRYAGGYDAYNKDNDPFDDHGHGTHVSGTIAADLNDVGLAGVAPKASIFAIKALSADGTGYTSDIVNAIDWAILREAQIINFSLGSFYDNSTLRAKINEAASMGIYLVAAAGNNYGGPLLYPAAYGNVISVAATDSNDRLAIFSNLGAEIAAPGVAVTSTIPGGNYATWSGTSMASPHVTATVALMIANKQTNIRENLQNTAVDLGPVGKDIYFGYGLVNAKTAALDKDTLAPVVTFLSPENNSKVSGKVKIELDVQDENTIAGVKLFIDNQLVKEWPQASYTYEWDTADLENKKYLILAQAKDNSDNTGEAKIFVTVSSTSSPTPALSPSPIQSATPSPAVSPLPIPSASPLAPSPSSAPTQTPKALPSPTNTAYPERGKSSEHRKDTDTPAEEQRQNYLRWLKNQERKLEKEEETKQDISEVTNINNRNPKPQKEKSSSSEKKQEKDKDKKVKGSFVQKATFLNRFLQALGF